MYNDQLTTNMDFLTPPHARTSGKSPRTCLDRGKPILMCGWSLDQAALRIKRLEMRTSAVKERVLQAERRRCGPRRSLAPVEGVATYH